jgi:hypothetical protein
MHPGEALAYVTDSGRHEVVTVDLHRARIVHRTRVPGPARHVSVGAGTILWTALGSAATRIAVLDLSDPRRPRLVRVFEPPFPAHDVVFAPDGGDRVWVTSGARNALALYRLHGGAPRVLATGAPPQHVAFSGSRVYVACGRDGTVERRGLDGAAVGTARVPHGSYNVSFGSFPAFARPAVVTPSLNEGTVTVLSPAGDVRFIRRVTRSAHDACVALAG